MTLFDTDRTAEHITQRVGKPFVIRHYGDLPLHCADTGVTVEAPVRAAGNSAQPIALEIGPFTVDVADAAALSQFLADFVQIAQWATSSDMDDQS